MPKATLEPQIVTLEITALNDSGHGEALYEGQMLEVPFTLPGEQVKAEIIWKTRKVKWARCLEILKPHSQRANPPCKHFGTCGGCSLQSVTPQYYDEIKRTKIKGYLDGAGIKYPDLAPTITIGPGARRRIDFLGIKRDNGLVLGFHEKQSRRRFNLEVCPVVTPTIEALFIPMHAMLDQILTPGTLIHIFLTQGTGGIDLLFAGLRNPFGERETEILKDFAIAHNLSRLAYKVKTRQTIIHEREIPHIQIAGHKVPISAFSFLQASAQSDQVLSQLVLDLVPQSAQKVVDLFCGRGTLSLPLVDRGYEVLGVECDPHALSALMSLNVENLKVKDRNLFEDPLSAQELQDFDAIVANPPRAGLGPQGDEMAKSGVQNIVYVSCNPQTFAQDAALLQKHGYILKALTPVDQFIWTGHMELVAHFLKE